MDDEAYEKFSKQEDSNDSEPYAIRKYESNGGM